MAGVPVVFALLVTLTVRGSRVEEFMGLEMPTCWFSCPGVCGKEPKLYRWTAACYCDDACPYFGDCCYNYFRKCRGMLFGDTLNFLYEIKRRKTSLEIGTYNDVARAARYSNCVAIAVRTTGNTYIYLINKCPDGFSDDVIRRKCEAQSAAFPLDVPVTNRWNVYEIFANVFCALCHLVSRHDIIVWESELICTNPCLNDVICESDTIADIEKSLATRELKQEHCWTVVEHHSASQYRNCNNKVPDGNCFTNNTSFAPIGPRQLTQSDLNVLCNSYIYTVQTGELMVRNAHCLTCAKNRIYDVTDLSCKSEASRMFVSIVNTIVFKANISALTMSYAFTNPNITFKPTSLNCTDSQTANALIGRCKDDLDPCKEPNWVNIRGIGCVDLLEPEAPLSKSVSEIYLMLRVYVSFETETSNFSKITLDLEKNTNMFFGVLHRVVLKHGLKGLNTTIENVSLSAVDTESGLVTKSENLHYVYTMTLNTRENLADSVKLTQIFFFGLKQFLNSSISLDSMVLSNMESFPPFLCPANRLVTPANMSLVQADGEMYAMSESTRNLVNLEDAQFSVELGERVGIFHLQKLTICVREQDQANTTAYGNTTTIDCPKIIFTDTEYTTRRERLIIGAHIIQDDMYMLNGTAALVCQDVVKSLLAGEDGANTLKTVSLATVEACIFVTVLTQLIRQDYKDDQSRIYLALMSTLAIAFGLDFADKITDFLPRLLAASLLHFFWLVSHFLNASSSGLLVQHARGKTSSVKGKMLLYFFTSTVIPAVVVLVCNVLEHGPSQVDIGYGSGRLVWWMGNTTFLLATAVVPCGILLLVAIGIHAYVICASRRRTGWLRTRFRSADALVLSVLLGLLLSVGFGAEYTGIAGLGYVYYALHVAMAASFIQNVVTTLVCTRALDTTGNGDIFTGIDDSAAKSNKEAGRDM